MKPINKKNKIGAQANTKVASLFSSKKGAMEMSMGTLVTIVLLMSVLILGLVLIKNIFKSSQGAIYGVDNAMQNEMNQMFSDDSSKTLILVPATKKITLKKGDDNLGFGFSIRNNGEQDAIFSYNISVPTDTSCGISEDKALQFIILGKSDSGIKIVAGNVLEDPVFIRFKIPENAPPCSIRYRVTVNKNGAFMNSKDMDVEIKSK